MILPNKFTPLDKSVIAKTPRIIEALDEAMTPQDLFCEVENFFEDMSEFIIALDLLYCLGRLDLKHGQLFLKK